MNKETDNMKSFQYRFDPLALSNNPQIFENFPQSTRLDNKPEKGNINYQNYTNPRSTNQTMNQTMNMNQNMNLNQNTTQKNYKTEKTKYIENYYTLPMNSTLPIHQNNIDAIKSINTRQ